MTSITDETDALYWKTSTWRTLKSYVKLLWQEGVTETTLASQIADSTVGRAVGDKDFARRALGVVFFAELQGEPITTPHLRAASCNEEFIKKLTRSALKARSGLSPDCWDQVNKINEGDVFFFTDGGCSGPCLFCVLASMPAIPTPT